MLCSPQAQGHKWLTKGPKNLIAAWIKEGREGGRVRARGSFLSFKLPTGRAKFLASESSVQHSTLITCERSKEAAVMCSSP